ncbi:hypothetical protein [Mesorhizobium sp. LSJC264A00]|uniref:hypothetical protein n=1 Tax=unclassified Mesorhizobium TaxID=325217 RepID=UPI0003CF9C45|nr:hypothetical protein [Mesorhizobium sp. LSJC264A00]ESX15949.1 hypothetical protein X767_27890 [Mesorhizobium sp. LSJC264A00]
MDRECNPQRAVHNVNTGRFHILIVPLELLLANVGSAWHIRGVPTSVLRTTEMNVRYVLADAASLQPAPTPPFDAAPSKLSTG